MFLGLFCQPRFNRKIIDRPEHPVIWPFGLPLVATSAPASLPRRFHAHGVLLPC